METATTTSDCVRRTNAKDRLQVGVLVDSLTLPRWAAHILEQVEKSTAAELAVIVARDGAVPAPAEVQSEAIPKLLQWWLELDRKLFAHRSANPDISKPVLFTPANGCVINRKHGDLTSDRTLAELRSMQLDVLLNLSSPEFSPKVRALAKHGVCWFNDDNDLLKDVFWVLRKDAIIESKINIDSSQRGVAALPACYSPADRYSFFRNFGVASEKRCTALQRYLAEIWRQNHLPASIAQPASAIPTLQIPGNLEIAVLIFRLLGRMLQDQLTKYLQRQEWFIAFRKVHPLESCAAGNGGFTLLRPPTGHFYADPFVIDKDGKTYIFFEDYCYASKKGAIAFVVIDSSGTCSAPDIALKEQYHLSYPCLLQWNGDIYILPDTKARRTVQIYRASDFPHRWELSHVLLEDISAVDSTLLHHDNKFWLFTCGINSSDPWFTADSELFLFSADSLHGPWRAHPKNPIVADVRRSRSAGQIMRWGNRLIRPAQDCSTDYGSAVVFNHIQLLSGSDYQENPIAKISRDWLARNRGTHTFNCSHTYEALDGRTPLSKFRRSHGEPRCEWVMLKQPLVTRF